MRLPSDSGFALARRLHARSEVSIIFLTARDAVADRVEGLELGADDYVVKPFALEELLARIRAVLRRSGRLSRGARGRGPAHRRARRLGHARAAATFR